MASIRTVAVYLDHSEAVAACSFLSAHGLFAVVPDRHLASTAWHLTHALGGVRLWVLDSELGAARELLRNDAASIPRQEGSSGEGQLVNREISILELITAICVLFLFGVPFPIWKRRNKCRSGSD